MDKIITDNTKVNVNLLERVQELETELEKELIFFQAWMVRYAKDPKDINLINDYLKTKR